MWDKLSRRYQNWKKAWRGTLTALGFKQMDNYQKINKNLRRALYAIDLVIIFIWFYLRITLLKMGFGSFLLLLVFIGILDAVMIHLRRNLPEQDENGNIIDPKGAYGDARFARDSDLEEADIKFFHDISITSNTVLGYQYDAENRERILTKNYTSASINGHMCICGASGTGKTYCLVGPNIFQTVKRRESLILSDPKGDLTKDYAGFLKKNGYVVKVLNLRKPRFSDTWNCLKEVSGDDMMNNADQFASIVMDNTGTDPSAGVYYSGPLSLLKAYILRVATGNDYEGKRTFGEVYNLLISGRDLDDVFDVKRHPEIAPALPALRSFRTASENLHGNLTTGLSSQIGVLQNPDIQSLLGEDDIDLELPGTRPCAYFIVKNAKENTYDFISALFFKFLFIKLTDLADNTAEGKLKCPVNFLLDEFCNFGVIKNFDGELSENRSRGINISFVIQDIPQLKNKYPYTWQSIISNCATVSLLGVGRNDPETAKFFSDSGGIQTLLVESEKNPAYKPITQFSTPNSRGPGKKELISQYDLETASKSELFIFLQNTPAVKALKYGLHNFEEYKTLEPFPSIIEMLPDRHDPDARADYLQQEQARVDDFDWKVSSGEIEIPEYLEEEPEIENSSAKDVISFFRDAVANRPMKAEIDLFGIHMTRAARTEVIDVDEYQETKRRKTDGSSIIDDDVIDHFEEKRTADGTSGNTSYSSILDEDDDILDLGDAVIIDAAPVYSKPEEEPAPDDMIIDVDLDFHFEPIVWEKSTPVVEPVMEEPAPFTEKPSFDPFSAGNWGAAEEVPEDGYVKVEVNMNDDEFQYESDVLDQMETEFASQQAEICSESDPDDFGETYPHTAENAFEGASMAPQSQSEYHPFDRRAFEDRGDELLLDLEPETDREAGMAQKGSEKTPKEETPQKVTVKDQISMTTDDLASLFS